MKSERPDTVHGRLLESVHLSGYTFERACAELDWLLTGDRWRSVGDGHTDINSFLATIDFSGLKIAIAERKKLAEKLAELEASQRATAKALGVGEQTIARDLGSPRGAPSGAPASQEPLSQADQQEAIAPHGAPDGIAELEAEQVIAKDVQKRSQLPATEEALVAQQRQTMIEVIERAMPVFELKESAARAHAQKLLAGGDAGPFTPERFEKVATYASVFADELRKGAGDGQGRSEKPRAVAVRG